jgi:tRNA U34 5-carboxymethylaminomethyl modifying GTPase MnmE/TrmE
MGLDLLTARIEQAAGVDSDSGEDLMASLRQIEALDTLERALVAAEQSLKDAPLEVSLVDFREALTAVSSLLGLDVGDAVLDRIFATFCLGK